MEMRGLHLEVAGLSFSYDGTRVLSGVTFGVDRGDMVGVIGPNGSGKTTLIACLTGALRSFSGTVRLDGTEISSFRPRSLAKKVAVVPQENAVQFEFTVADIVTMGREPHLRPFAREGPEDLSRVAEAMRATSTLHLADRLAWTLSGGERQRMLIARALAQEPQVLFLDEPTAHLDLAYQHDVLQLLKRLNDLEGLTVIAAMHDLNLAARYFSRFVLLAGGTVVASGGLEEVITEENVALAYGVKVRIQRRSSGHPFVDVIGLPRSG